VAEERHDRPWHALDGDEVAKALDTGEEGLSAQAAARRLEEHGPNQIEEIPPPSNLRILLHQFQSPLIYILLVAAAVTVVIQEYVDAGVIAAVLILNATIGFFQERRAEHSVRALMQLTAPQATVVREAQAQEVESRELVPGDLVLLESGTRVPADLRLIVANSLDVDESLLTGESVPVGKSIEPLDQDTQVTDRANLAFTGSIVTSGRGRGYVVATGADTELGTIAERVREEVEPETPLQRRMARFAHIVGIAIGVSALVAFVIGIVLGEPITEMFLVAVALAVAAIPEGLPVVFTITLALGVRRMARRQAFIRRLPAVETLGSTTVIGSDKTGTLTENRMTVRRVWTAAGEHALEEDGDGEAPPTGHPLHETLLAGVLTNEAQATRTDDGFKTRGDPTEAALLVASSRVGIDPEEARQEHRTEAEVPFESQRRYSAAIRRRDGDHVLFVKGAPERVVEMCDEMLSEEGPKPLDEEAVLGAAREMADEGLRVLAMASRVVEEVPSGEDVPEPEGMVFLGLQGMLDPPREGVLEAVQGSKDAGIRVVMITGDHALTARAIARELRIAEDGEVLSGRELEDLDDDELRERVTDVSVYARVSPEHKLRVVRAFRDRDEVVAVTGDGVNDAPALKAADIGIAMGQSGTDVAKEASDMVLADDNFVSIHDAVEEGRITFDNVRKVTFFLISTGAAAIIAILTTQVLGWPLPMLPAQLLWLNLVTNGLQDVALAFEPGEPGVLKRPPRPRDEGVVSRLLWERTAVAGVVMAVGTLVLFHWEWQQTGSVEQARTVALTTMVLFQNFHVGNARSEHRSVFRISPLSNRFLLAAVLSALSIHIAALHLGPTQFILRVEPVEAAAWVRMAAVAVTIVAAMEIHKAIRRRRSE
jgi:calcium-translocating P-type ATPase